MSERPANPASDGRGGGDDIEIVLQGKPRDVDGLPVRRALPSRNHRLVGPFIFFDHMGPARLEPGRGMDVRPHPHIGLLTVTYLFDGELVHRDSLGYVQTIVPGDLNWMTAGRGIVHSERSGDEMRANGMRVHGIQAWVALPLDHEECEPSFVHHPASSLPTVSRPGTELRVIAGEAYGARSPVQVLSPMFYVDARVQAGTELKLPAQYAERGAYVVAGAIECDGTPFEAGSLIVFRAGPRAALHAVTDAHVMLLGGAGLEGTRHIDWNFVASKKERIEQAKRDWRARLFPSIPSDDEEFVPLPE